MSEFEKKALAESLNANPKFINNRYVKAYIEKCRAEAKLLGNVTDDGTSSVDPTLDFISQIIMGLEKYKTTEFARLFTSDKATMKIPLGVYGTASVKTSDEFTNSPKTQTELDVAFDEEQGTEVTWTRAHIEDAPWDVMAEQNEGAGYAIQVKLCNMLVTALAAIPSPDLAGGEEYDIADPLTYDLFRNMLKTVDVAGYGPADYFLAPVAKYWDLLAEDEFINSLYAGTDEVMRTGIAKTMLGVTVIKISDVAAEQCFALNSRKAIALCQRRGLTVEPFEYPDINEYGFVASVRAKAKVMWPGCVCRGDETPS